MEIKEKQKLCILFGIMGVVFLILYYSLLLRPLFVKFLLVNREFYALRARVKSAEDLVANEERIKRQYENLKEWSEKGFLGRDEVSSLLEDFSTIAEASRVKIQKIKPLESLGGVSKAAAAELPIEIEARGGYHQCGMFINKLEDMDRFVKIDEIDIKGRFRDPQHHDIRLRVTAYIMQ